MLLSKFERGPQKDRNTRKNTHFYTHCYSFHTHTFALYWLLVVMKNHCSWAFLLSTALLPLLVVDSHCTQVLFALYCPYCFWTVTAPKNFFALYCQLMSLPIHCPQATITTNEDNDSLSNEGEINSALLPSSSIQFYLQSTKAQQRSPEGTLYFRVKTLQGKLNILLCLTFNIWSWSTQIGKHTNTVFEIKCWNRNIEYGLA